MVAHCQRAQSAQQTPAQIVLNVLNPDQHLIFRLTLDRHRAFLREVNIACPVSTAVAATIISESQSQSQQT
jgi:hypothetical protein